MSGAENAKKLNAIADRMLLFAISAKMPASAEILKKWAAEIKKVLKEKE